MVYRNTRTLLNSIYFYFVTLYQLMALCAIEYDDHTL